MQSVESFTNHEGLGVQGVVAGRAVVAGRPQLLADWSVAIPDVLAAAQRDAEEAGRTAIMAAIDGKAAALFTVADTAKPTSAEAVAQLKALGLRPILLTGDNETVARTVARAVRIDEVIAEVLPADKVARIKELQAQGRIVWPWWETASTAAKVEVVELSNLATRPVRRGTR